ncbi:hypothetical protein QWY86_13065 [Pedobacter aquatilis]|uniref:FEKKY domain-containing protein n=1 Tax=Pedobacter aquatilis TaxID=351343 RepID=UPI0025B29333|nr:hypothetical protein [Pedobacter aquatilis]MDN3587605.1 hypothetical protein [Pedobacter aquatilis]
MKAITIILLSFLFTNQLKAADVVNADTTISHSIKLAQSDIKKGNIKFLIMGGFAPKHYKGENLFAKKYGIKYYQYGCVLPASISIVHYNKVVANYMDGKYGKGWRKEVRNDVVMEDVRFRM